MNYKISFILSMLVFTSLTACDSKQNFNQPRTETMRTMIIGGVPVHDRDFKINPALP
ncbi:MULTISPECIES: NF038215 family lipoprotein [unclassified Acinetobacter]|uniref:NF038215 family lipoprotein n=1 Tax=unclassified Acinetobacter TaxID=196816 RepID=UPI0029348824|nr:MULTISPECIES: NF038215 family lipoprotein [unclassified Acinetobacter]WOE32823.1 NF038215 family lipoprotein [Acinetobacter sp. SAAs470]WOE38300.1 NF038215 family lipoprotein [Acinetobacter sp. SAAs474]